jgi:DNA-binding XRE family transcriptional regulator
MRTLHKTVAMSSIREGLNLSRESFAKVFQVSSRTISRWEEEDGPKSENHILLAYKLKEILDLACQVYTEDGLREFLFEPQPIFEGKTAFQLMSIGDHDRVLTALYADFEGAGF